MTDSKLFENLNIIDLSTVLAGPSVGSFFAELGANVVKIEHPDHPDVTRSWKLENEPEDAPVSAYFSSINYGKKYLTLDLKRAEHHERFIECWSQGSLMNLPYQHSYPY